MKLVEVVATNKTSIKPLTKKQCNQHKNIYKKKLLFCLLWQSKRKRRKTCKWSLICDTLLFYALHLYIDIYTHTALTNTYTCCHKWTTSLYAYNYYLSVCKDSVFFFFFVVSFFFIISFVSKKCKWKNTKNWFQITLSMNIAASFC